MPSSQRVFVSMLFTVVVLFMNLFTLVFCESRAADEFTFSKEVIDKPCAGYARSFSSYQVSEVRNAVRAALKKRCDAETNQVDASDACKAHHTDRYARLGHAEMTRVLHGFLLLLKYFFPSYIRSNQPNFSPALTLTLIPDPTIPSPAR